MGFFSRVANQVRRVWAQDKAQDGSDVAKGSVIPSAGMPNGGLLAHYGNEYLSEYLRLDSDLLSRYADYEDMDDYPELSTALDIYADDVSQPDTQTNRTVWVTSEDENLKTVLDDLFHRQLRLDEEIWEIARTLVKYGNDFEEILVTDEGVKGLNFLPVPTVRRIEGGHGDLHGFVQDFSGRLNISPGQFQEALKLRQSSTGDGSALNVTAFEDWEVVHFRLRGKQRRSLYGHSALEPARWIYKRLNLLEDAALVYRLQRAPERYAFYVDVGDLPPQEALAYINKVRMSHRKRRFIDPNTGKLTVKWEPLVQDEDFYVPVRKGVESARIETLGAPAWQSMDDIEYFRDKLFAAIKVPKAYLGQESGVARAVLSSEDVRFARTILRIQRELRNGLRKIARVHLAALGIDPFSADYDIWMTVPSSIFELAQLEVRNARADLAQRMQGFVSIHWLLSKVFGLSDDEIEVIMEQRKEDAEQQMQMQMGGMAPPGGPMPGPMPGAEEAPAEEPGGMDFGAPPAEGEAGVEEAIRKNAQQFQRLPVRKPSGITERQLLAGDRSAEKRAEAQLEQLLKSDKALAHRLNEISAMLQELRQATRRR